MSHSYSERGISLYLALVYSSLIMVMAFGVSGVFITQMKSLKRMEHSVTSFYAADTGIERVLYDEKVCSTAGCSSPPCPVGCTGLAAPYSIPLTLIGQASYKVNSVGDPITGFRSVGIYKNDRRAIEIWR